MHRLKRRTLGWRLGQNKDASVLLPSADFKVETDDVVLRKALHEFLLFGCAMGGDRTFTKQSAASATFAGDT